MIDVSRFKQGERCPRCAGRRVVAVSIPADRWRCAPNAQPFPLGEDIREHEAFNTEEFFMFEEETEMTKKLKAQHRIGAGNVG